MGALDGRVAIVTGAGAGLGLGIATELARAGAAVAVAEIDAEAGERAVSELGELGVPARFYATDVASREQVDAAFVGAERDLGPIDVVVNNAGISRVGPHTQDVTDEDWHDSIAVMQTGVFYCMRAAGRHMLPRGSGSVVNISSIRGFSPNVGSYHVLRAEGGRDHDDAGRGRRMGAAGRPCQRRLPGHPQDPHVGHRRRARGDRRDVLPRDGPGTAGSASRRRWARSSSISPPTPPRTSPGRCSRSTVASRRFRRDRARRDPAGPDISGPYSSRSWLESTSQPSSVTTTICSTRTPSPASSS